MQEVIVTKHEMKGCPFCGGNGYVFREQIYSKGGLGHYGNYNYYAGCLNPVCTVQPKTRGVDDFYRCSDEAIEIVVNDWNTRR